jgi:hypothetical protein
MTKKRRRHTPEQIIRKLEEGHRQLAAGKDLDEVCAGIWRSRSRRGIAGSPSTAG